MKILLQTFCAAILFSVLACSTKTEEESPHDVLALIHQADSMTRISAFKGSFVVPFDFDSYEITYTLSEKSNDLLYYKADGIEYFCAANGMLGFTRDTLDVADSLIIQELFFQKDRPFYSRRIDAKSNKILRQGILTEFEGDGTFFSPDYVREQIQDRVITLGNLEGIWIELIRDENEEGEVLTIPCETKGLEFKLNAVTPFTVAGFERTNRIDSSYYENGSLVLLLEHMGYVKFSPYRRAIISYGVIDRANETLLFKKSMRGSIAIDEERCDDVFNDEPVKVDSTSNE